MQAGAKLRRLGVGAVVLTLGNEGAYVEDAKGGRFLPAIPPKRIVDVTGAGDALVAGYAYGILRPGAYEPAVLGLAAASLALETRESVPPDLWPERLLERTESYVRRRKRDESVPRNSA